MKPNFFVSTNNEDNAGMTKHGEDWLTSLGLAVLAGLTYWVFGKFGTLFAISGTSMSVFWPPDAATLAILLLAPRRYWAFIVLGSWLGDFPNEYAMSPVVRDSLILATTDSLMVLVPAFIIRSVIGDITINNSIRWFVALVIVYCLISVPICGAVLSLLVYGHDYTLIELLSNMKNWVLGSTPSSLIFVPLIIAVYRTIFNSNKDVFVEWGNPKTLAIFTICLSTVVAASYYEFLVYYLESRDTLNLFVPILFILAYVYGLIGAGAGCAIVLVFSGLTPFYLDASTDPNLIPNTIFDLQMSELANIAGAMLLACVTTRLRFVNREQTSAMLHAEQKEKVASRRAGEIEQLYMHAPVGLCLMDKDYRYVRINQLMADINGVSVGDHIGRTLHDILPKPLANQIANLYRPVFESGEPVRNVEIHGENGIGSPAPRDWLGNFIPLKSEVGEVIGLIGVVLEITERKRLEVSQRESARKARYEEKRFRDIAESSAELFFEFDENERFTYCSAPAYNGSEVMIGKLVKEVFAPTPEEFAINSASWEERGRAIMECRPFRKVEFDLPGADGRREIVSVSGVPVFDEDGLFRGYRGSSTTITSKYREMALLSAKTAADAANMAKSEFLSNMSHEIRTPMNAILGLTHLLGRTPLTSEQSDCVTKIMVSGRALMGILNDILDLSKIEAGRMDLETIDFRVEDVISTLATIMSVTAADKDLETIIGIDNPVPNWLRGDPSRLQQVLVNLVGNAIKFTKTGEVTVHAGVVERTSDRVMIRFSVCDTGIGISPDQQAKLFVPFSQADMTTTRRFGGTGLGLVICKRLVDLMGGTMGFNSQPGQGSEFWFTLPFEIGRPVENEPEPILTNLEVLVVDDNATARMYLSATAESIGMHPDTVESGQKAIDRLHERVLEGETYDLLLVDWQMPGLNGLETSRAIRNEAVLAGAQPPIVIMVTAFSREEVLSSPDARYVDGILVKPVTASALLNVVAEVQARRHGGLEPLLAEARRGRSSVLARLRNVRILVVEDNGINQDVARRILEEEGAIVEISEDGAAAVERLRGDHGDHFDLVLMDAQMPIMDGFTATTIIRQELGLTSLPIIALTAGVRVEDQERCRSCGMSGFVAKPFDVPHLMTTILQHLGRHTEASSDGPMATLATIPSDQAARLNIPGLDFRQALLRVAGKTDLLISMLKRLVCDFGDIGNRVRTNFKEGRPDHAAREMHTLRGSAGNLAVVEVAALANWIETAIRDGAPLSSITPKLVELEATFNAFSLAVQGLNEEEDGADGAKTLDAAKLASLITLLDNEDLNALTAYRAIRPEIITAVSVEQRQNLDRSIDDLDLEAAKQILISLQDGVS